MATLTEDDVLEQLDAQDNLFSFMKTAHSILLQGIRQCIDSLEVRKKTGGHWIIRDLMGLDLVGLASL